MNEEHQDPQLGAMDGGDRDCPLEGKGLFGLGCVLALARLVSVPLSLVEREGRAGVSEFPPVLALQSWLFQKGVLWKNWVLL